MESGRLMFSSAAPSRAGGGQMMLFGGSGSFLGGSPAVSGVEEGRRKRPFLTTALDDDPQMEYDDEMYGYGGLDLDEHAPERTKRRLTAEQVRALERSFEEEKRKLEPERKSELARRLGMAPRQVAVWFQNRRARWKTKQLERDFDALRAAHDDLLAGRDKLLAENDSLRLQVISLMEELQAKASSPVSEPEEHTHTTASGMVHAGSPAPPTLAAQPKEGCACAAEINVGARVARAPAMGVTGDSPESYSCFADARSPPSSSDDDCGGAASSGGGCAFFLPDGAMLEAVAGVERESEAEAAQHNYWAWFWN